MPRSRRRRASPSARAKLIAELRAAGLGHQLTKAIGLRRAVIAAADAFTSKPETAP
jgi:hypothetical protein